MGAAPLVLLGHGRRSLDRLLAERRRPRFRRLRPLEQRSQAA